MRTPLSLMLWASLSGACALAPREQRPPVVVMRAGGAAVARDVHFTEVYASEVVVSGIWSVIVTVDPSDMIWIRELASHHGEADLVLDGRVVWTFHAEDRDFARYFISPGFNDEPTARRTAEAIRLRHGTTDPGTGQPGETGSASGVAASAAQGH
jgi:hypothetical protein